MKNRIPGLFLLSVGMLLLSACAPVVKHDQPSHTTWVTLDSTHRIGQTFTARYAGMQGIALLLEAETAGEGNLILDLFTYEQRDIPIKTVTISLASIIPGRYQQFLFGNIAQSTMQDYYFRLTMQGDGRIRVGAGPGASYLNGAAYYDEIAQDQQLAFRLIYSPGMVARGLLLEGMGWLFRLAIGILLFVVPGWGILTLIYPNWQSLDWVEKTGLAAGVSLAIYPLLMLWSNLIGLHLGIFIAWIPILAGVSTMFWRFANRPPALTRVREIPPADVVRTLAYLAILAVILLSRIWPIRGLDAPLWGDSIHHTIISQLIVDHNGLFTSWAPYAELTSFTYHFGFHTLVAAFHWMTGLEMSQAVLWTGQIMNVLALVVMVPLANRLSGNRWAGLIALIVSGLLASIPQVYLNWGRYTQLTGQVVLLVFVYIAWEFLSKSSSSRPLTGLTAVLLAGLGLTHSRIFIFALAFLAIFFAAYLRQIGFRKLVFSLVLTGVSSLLLYLPWLVRILPSTILQFFLSQISPPSSQLAATNPQIESILQYATMIPGYLWWLSGIALLLGIWRREKTLLVFVAWCLLVLLTGNPHWVGLPGSGVIGGFTVMIAAYILVGVLVSYLTGYGVERLFRVITQPHWKTLFAIGLFVLSVVIGLGSLRLRLADIQIMASALFTRADQRAAEWISANLPEDSLILVNSFLAYENTVAVGSDGGWWLPYKARRAITLPPINYSLEDEPRPGYRNEINEVTAAILEKGITDPQVQSLLDERGVTHVYLGQQQGSVNYAGPPISAEQLLSMDSYKPIYHEDRVWIFERKQP